MPRRRQPPDTTIAVWGYYAVMMVPEAVAPGGTQAGLVKRTPTMRAFWATWWTEDPRRRTVEPDDYGFVEGREAHFDAIGAAYDALRRGRGPRVYDVSVGEDYAAAAYREGAPTRRTVHVDFDALARQFLERFGLAEDASPKDVLRAYRRGCATAHPDKGGDAVAFADLTALYEAAKAFAAAREAVRSAARMAAGEAPPPPKKRRAKKRDQVTAPIGGSDV